MTNARAVVDTTCVGARKMENAMEKQLDTHRPLVLASVSFALLWVLGMLWWSGPMNTARAVVLVAFGILAGILWYFGMKLWMRWFVQQLW